MPLPPTPGSPGSSALHCTLLVTSDLALAAPHVPHATPGEKQGQHLGEAE